MKITITILLVFMLGVLGVLGYGIWFRNDAISFKIEITKAIGDAADQGGVVAAVGDIKTRLTGSNLDRLLSTLTAPERDMDFRKAPTEGDPIDIQFGETLHLVVSRIRGEEDKALIEFTNGSKQRLYTIKGYDTYNWTLRIVSPGGYYEPNEVVS